MRHFDASGNEYRTYSSEGDSKAGNVASYTNSRMVAGDLVDLSARFFMEKTGEKDYSKAVHTVLAADPQLKRDYIGG